MVDADQRRKTSINQFKAFFSFLWDDAVHFWLVSFRRAREMPPLIPYKEVVCDKSLSHFITLARLVSDLTSKLGDCIIPWHTYIVLVIDLCLKTDQKQGVTKDNKLVGNSKKYRFLSLSTWNRSEINLFERGKYKTQFYAIGTSKYWLHKTLITSWFLYKNHQPYCAKCKLVHRQLQKLFTVFINLNLKCYCTR